MASHFVCIVDDDDSVRAALDGLVRSLGHVTDTFASAREFLGAQRTRPYDCVILDVQMPDLDGLQVQQQLLTEARCPPLIFVTGHPKPGWRDRAMAAGALAFLAKPYECATLVALIEQACRMGLG